MTDFLFGKGGVVMFRKIARHLIVLNVQAVIRHAALVDVSCFQSGYLLHLPSKGVRWPTSGW